jgi:hypothetical protein
MNNKMVHTGWLSTCCTCRAIRKQSDSFELILLLAVCTGFAYLRHQWKVGISNLKHRELPVLRKIRCEDERSFALSVFNSTAQDQFKCGARRKIALLVNTFDRL